MSHYGWSLNGQVRDAWLWIGSLQLIGFGLLVGVNRKQVSLTQVGGASLVTLLGLITAWLLFIAEFDRVALWLADAASCLVVVLCWGMVTIGSVWLVIEAQKLRKSRSSRFQLIAKLWLIAVSLLMTVEAGMRIVDKSRSSELSNLKLPESYNPSTRPTLVSIGGSTMMGFPYQPKVSIPSVMAHAVKMQTGVEIDVTNVAVGGIALHEAAERLGTLQVKPDLLVVYTGHNEYFKNLPLPPIELRFPRKLLNRFFHWSRTFQLGETLIAQDPRISESITGGPTGLIQPVIFEPTLVSKRNKQFELHLKQLAEHCQKHSIPMLWFLPASNEGVFSPNRSVLSRAISPSENKRLTERFTNAKILAKEGNAQSALKQLEQIDEEYPEVSEIQFWIGNCLRDLGQTKLAIEAYRNARDHDGQPPTATSAQRKLLRKVANECGIELLDAEQILREISPTGLIDRHLIHDNVHPTLRAFYALGVAGANAKVTKRVYLMPQESFVAKDHLQRFLKEKQLDSEDLALAYERTMHCIIQLGLLRSIDTDRDLDAEQYQKWADMLRNGMPPGEGGTEGLSEGSLPGVHFH